ncbi:MAG: hypothetical protein AAF211_24105 [Myxococcota bacterium]
MWWMLLTPAMADPAVEEIEIVKPEYREGAVSISFPGREGDVVKCDGWNLGTLPVETRLLEGVRSFEVLGKERFKVTIDLAFEGEETLALDLSKAVSVDVAAPSGIRVISNSANRRRADGSFVMPSEDDKPKEPESKAPAPETPAPAP